MQQGRRRKLVLIGAGSVSFTQGLVGDMIRAAMPGGWTLALVDIDQNALDTARKLTRKFVAAAGADIDVQASVERKELLPGADYVVTTIGVGGRRAWEQDVFIPRKYGVYQPVGDTALPGGISRAMRMIPAMIDIARDVADICPGAWFFNYANPMSANCLAVARATGLGIVGLCHGVFHTEASLAQWMGVPLERSSALTAGINHLGFTYDFRIDGQDATTLLAERVRSGQTGAEPFSKELFERLGAFPVPGDRHITEFFPERFADGWYYDKRLGIDAFSFEGTIEGGDKGYARMQALAHSGEPLDQAYLERFSGEHELLVQIIDSIENDRRRVFSANVPNRGAIANLPDEALVEIPVAACGRGLLPLMIRDFPEDCAKALRPAIDICEMTVQAALEGDRFKWCEAVRMGGHMKDADIARMVDELIDAHRQYLPQF